MNFAWIAVKDDIFIFFIGAQKKLYWTKNNYNKYIVFVSVRNSLECREVFIFSKLSVYVHV